MPDEARYAIGDLADLGGVSRRTVRYYDRKGSSRRRSASDAGTITDPNI